VLRTAVKWGHLQENPARGVDLPRLRNVRPKWALTTLQAEALLNTLPPLARTMVGLALLSGLRRGELFALRWRDLADADQCLTVREAVYEGVFGTPKTDAGCRRIPLSQTAWMLLDEWKQHAKRTDPDALIFATWSGKPRHASSSARICPGTRSPSITSGPRATRGIANAEAHAEMSRSEDAHIRYLHRQLYIVK